MANKKTDYLTEAKKYVTGKVYLVYPHLAEAYAFNTGDAEKYQVLLMFPKDNNNEAENFKSLINSIWKEAKLKANDHNPLMDGDNKAKLLEDEGKNGDMYKGMYYIKASSQYPVKVVDGKKLNWTGLDNDINGNFGRAVINLKAYNQAGNRGITCYLKSVQVLGKGIDIMTSDYTKDFDYEEVVNTENEEDLPF